MLQRLGGVEIYVPAPPRYNALMPGDLIIELLFRRTSRHEGEGGAA